MGLNPSFGEHINRSWNPLLKSGTWCSRSTVPNLVSWSEREDDLVTTTMSSGSVLQLLDKLRLDCADQGSTCGYLNMANGPLQLQAEEIEGEKWSGLICKSLQRILWLQQDWFWRRNGTKDHCEMFVAGSQGSKDNLHVLLEQTTVKRSFYYASLDKNRV